MRRRFANLIIMRLQAPTVNVRRSGTEKRIAWSTCEEYSIPGAISRIADVIAQSIVDLSG
jgi:hypothetical protein